MFDKTKLIVAAVCALIILVVVLQNTTAVETKILFLTLTMPRAALLASTLVIGFGLGYLTSGYVRRAASRKEKPDAAGVKSPPAEV